MPHVANRSTTLGIVEAKGCYLTTDDGRKILDFASGVAVCNLGHNHDKVIEAAKKQMDKIVHCGHNVVYYEPYVKLAEKIVELTGGNTMLYFSNSGAEVNDGALKLAKYVTERPAIIAFKNSFHGRTIACTAITGSNAKYRKNYEGLIPSVYWAEYANCFRCPFGKKKEACGMECLKQFDDIFSKLIAPETVAAMIVEPVQGEGGYIVPPVKFLQGLRKICDENGILLILDEIQTGFGRTGNMFAYQTMNVKPDIITLAKGIANGFPLSALVAKRELMERWPAGAHGGTFGGNPVACAASLATIAELEHFGVSNAKKMGEYTMGELKRLKDKYSVIGDVRGVGLMIGIEIVNEDGSPNPVLTKHLITEALEKNVLFLSCGSDKNVLRLIAPTIVTEKEIDKGISVIDEILESVDA